MSEVERLESELALAHSAEALEEARDAMHADRNPKTIAAYKGLSKEHATLRTEHRLAFPTAPQADGDGVANPDTVKVEVKTR